MLFCFLGIVCKIYCGDGFYGDFFDWKCKFCEFECCICVDGILFRVCISCYDDWYLLGVECVISCVFLFVV